MQHANVFAKLSFNEIFNLKAKNKPVVVYVFGAYLDVRRLQYSLCTTTAQYYLRGLHWGIVIEKGISIIHHLIQMKAATYKSYIPTYVCS